MENVPLLSDMASRPKPKCHAFKIILFIVAVLSGFALFQLGRLSSVPSDVARHLAGVVDYPTAMTIQPRQLASQPEISVKFLQYFYAKHAKERTRCLDSIDENSTTYRVLYNVLVPEVYCPDLVRVGSVEDGGKWVCKPTAMPKEDCGIYSFGLNNEVSFDKEIQSFNGAGCRLHGYDMSEMSNTTKTAYAAINGEIKRVTVAAETAKALGRYTVDDLMKENNEPSHVEMIKMDIEEAEHYALLPLLDRRTTCQIFLEMHGSPYKMRQLLKGIASRGYRLFSYEVNGNTLHACEYSFIHLTCMKKYGVFNLAPYLAASSDL